MWEIPVKGLQFAVFFGWCHIYGHGSLSPTGSDILPLGIGGALIVAGQILSCGVFYRLGKPGVLYGNQLGYDIPWSRAFPFSWFKHPPICWHGVLNLGLFFDHALSALRLVYASSTRNGVLRDGRLPRALMGSSNLEYPGHSGPTGYDDNRLHP
jgi:hypothetical protein